MIKLDQLKPGTRVNGIVPEETVELLAVERNGPNSVSVAYRRGDGRLGERVLYRSDQAALSAPPADRLRPFDADGRLLSL